MVSFLALPVVGPAVLVLATAVALESVGGGFFLQRRVGLHGRDFRMLKLRTMVKDAERLGAGLYGEKNDPRLTRIGKFLRRWSLDELPQIFNVLKGDMSLVGPRPQLRLIVDRHSDAYNVILRVKPGITGLAQIRGRNELRRSDRLRLDMEYAQTWSLLGDLRIIAKTLAVVIRGEGQRNDQSEADVEG